MKAVRMRLNEDGRPLDVAVHRTKETPSKSIKKPYKIPKKNLNSVFSSVSEDISSESSKEQCEFSPDSEVCDGSYQLEESPGSEFLALNPKLLVSSETSQIATGVAPASCCRHCQCNDLESGSMDVELLLSHLRSNKVREEVVKIIVDELYAGMPGERDRFPESFAAKASLVILSLGLWLLYVWAYYFCTSSKGFHDPPPT